MSGSLRPPPMGATESDTPLEVGLKIHNVSMYFQKMCLGGPEFISEGGALCIPSPPPNLWALMWFLNVWLCTLIFYIVIFGQSAGSCPYKWLFLPVRLSVRLWSLAYREVWRVVWEHLRTFYSTFDTTIWKTIFDGRRPLMEDAHWWKTTFNGRQPLMKDKF